VGEVEDVKSEYAWVNDELGIAETCGGNKKAVKKVFEEARKDRSGGKNAE
jgi:hypothetical protein